MSLLIVVPALFRFLWDKHVDMVFASGDLSYHAMSAENYSATFTNKSVEDIKMISKHGELFEFNIFSATLSWSRLHIFVYSVNKTRADVERCLIHVFRYIGGIPKELLTDNMKSVVDISTKDGKTTKRINPEFNQFIKDMGTTIKTCKARSPETKR